MMLVLEYLDTKKNLCSIAQDTLNTTPDNLGGSCVFVRESEFSAWADAGNPVDAYAEFCLLCMPTSEALLPHDRCVFHAAALSHHDQAWLITAGSGVGKSTQCRTLMELWPEEFSMINGDKPVLEALPDGGIMVHPSPWNGKEGWHGASAAPLGGIVLLRRGDINSIVPLPKEKAAAGIFQAIFQEYREEGIIRQAAAMAEKIAESCPIWLMTSHEVPDSTKLLYECIKEEAGRHGL